MNKKENDETSKQNTEPQSSIVNDCDGTEDLNTISLNDSQKTDDNGINNLRQPDSLYDHLSQKIADELPNRPEHKIDIEVAEETFNNSNFIGHKESDDVFGSQDKNQEPLNSNTEAQTLGTFREYFRTSEQRATLEKLLKEELLEQQRMHLQSQLSRKQISHSDCKPTGDSEGDEHNTKEYEISLSETTKRQLQSGRIVNKSESISCILVSQKEVPNYSRNPEIQRIVIGGHQKASKSNKLVLLFGSRGVGKTSLVNSMLNYLYGVKKHYNFRFALQEKIQPTKCLVEYVINNSILPYSITLVDTPGIVNVSGYIETSCIIREWFEESLLKEGRFRLDAITVVLKSDDEELSWPYIHELAAVKKLFGDNLKKNVLPVITFAEVLPQPLAVRALAYANITFLEYYKVNNVGFSVDDITPTKYHRNPYFEQNVQSFQRYFTDLNNLEYPLLSLKSAPYVAPPKTEAEDKDQIHR